MYQRPFKRPIRFKGGYVAIVSALILVALLSIIALALSSSALFTRYNTQVLNARKNSEFLSDSCLQIAMLKLAASSSYAGNETQTIGSSTCQILPIVTLGSNKILEALASSSDSSVDLKLTIDATTFTKVSLEEI